MRSYGSPGRDRTLCWDTEALDQALLLAVTLRHQGHNPFTVHTSATSPASPLSTWAPGFSHPPICLRHSARRSDWTPVPGLFLVNLYGSPGLGLNVPSHQHVHKKTGRNEIPAPRKRPHASYANNGRQLRGHFPTLLTTLRQTNEKGGVLERP